MTPEWEEEHEGLHGYGVMRASSTRGSRSSSSNGGRTRRREDVPGLGYVGVPR